MPQSEKVQFCVIFLPSLFSLLFNFFLSFLYFLEFRRPYIVSGSRARDNSEHEGGSAKPTEHQLSSLGRFPPRPLFNYREYREFPQTKDFASPRPFHVVLPFLLLSLFLVHTLSLFLCRAFFLRPAGIIADFIDLLLFVLPFAQVWETCDLDRPGIRSSRFTKRCRIVLRGEPAVDF